MRHSTFRTRLLQFFSAVIIILIVGYGLFEARKIIEGPQLVIESPIDGAIIHGAVVNISGMVQNAAFISVNDTPVLADSLGNFNTKITPPEGYGILKIYVADRFGRNRTKLLHIMVEI